MAHFVGEIDDFLASFSPEETAVARHAFRAILDGEPATAGELPAALGLSPVAVEAALARLVERGAMVLDPHTERILGVRGLSLLETAHRLKLDGRQRYAWCAVDAVGIPAGLGADARVESHCQPCGAPLVLELRQGAVAETPDRMVVWAVERDLSRSLRAHT